MSSDPHSNHVILFYISRWQQVANCFVIRDKKISEYAHGVGRVVGALGSEAGFAASMLNLVISMMHVFHYLKHPKLQYMAWNQKKIFFFSSSAWMRQASLPRRGI